MKVVDFARKNYPQVLLLATCLIAFTWLFLPVRYFQDIPRATVLLSQSGQLLSASLADDGQWRFPTMDSVPRQFATCVKLYEDRYFDYHFGVNPWAIIRALYLNIKNGRVVSGGSTITMQTIRLAHPPQKRSVFQKVKEVAQAIRLEVQYSKEDILKMHASNAPFGGNIVGLETASWRYFNRSSFHLSWAEYAMLAVLPNAPGLIHTGRNREELKEKRNHLLKRLLNEELIDSSEYRLSLLEEVPPHPHRLPQMAPQLLQYAKEKGAEQKVIRTTIDKALQGRCQSLLDRYLAVYAQSQIFNGALLVADIESGHVLAYVGNGSPAVSTVKSHWVDIIQAPRSTGSILKPFLYAAMLHEGQILPQSLVEDVPTYLSGYAPKNYGKDYDGVVPADRALSRSLNVPAVRMLRDYSYPKFHSKLKKLGMTTLSQSPGHYGLSIILGGAEGTLWDICGMYASMGRILIHQKDHNLEYRNNDIRPLRFMAASHPSSHSLGWDTELSAASIWQTFEAMEKVHRPENQVGWEYFGSSRKVAWKTGTSFGYRDAWAVGVDGKYVIGVWIGNADGTGRDGLVGVKKAAPILFEAFGNVERTDWFVAPLDDHKQQLVCRQSGFPASANCTIKDTQLVPNVDFQNGPCPYHQTIHLDATGQFRVHARCETPSQMRHESWFVLPPVQEYYFEKKHPWYKKMPEWRNDCQNTDEETSSMSFIYPEDFSRIKIPLELDGSYGAMVFKLAHRKPQSRVFWYIDQTFLGETQGIHERGISPAPGNHRITVVDEDGQSISRQFKVMK